MAYTLCAVYGTLEGLETDGLVHRRLYVTQSKPEGRCTHETDGGS